MEEGKEGEMQEQRRRKRYKRESQSKVKNGEDTLTIH